MSMTETQKHYPYLEWYLPFYLLLGQYRIGIFPVGTLGLLFVAILMAWRRDWKIKRPVVDASVTLFFLYVVFNDLTSALLGRSALGPSVNRILSYSATFLLAMVVTDGEMNEETLFRAWKTASIFYFAGLLYQMVCLYGLGRSIAPISLMPGVYLRGDEGYLLNRPSSFFAEPALFSTAILPFAFLALKRGSYSWAVIVTLAVLASTSTVGIVLSFILWGLAFFNTSLKTGRKLLVLVCIAAVAGVFLRSGLFSSGLAKLEQVLDGGSTVSSRILCGFETIGSMKPVQWIFGTTYNDVNDYIRENLGLFASDSPVFLYFSRKGTVFINTFCMLIFKYGVVGLAIFLGMFFKRLRAPQYGAKPLLVMSLAGTLAQSMLLNSLFFMIVMIMLLYDNEKKCRRGA